MSPEKNQSPAQSSKVGRSSLAKIFIALVLVLAVAAVTAALVLRDKNTTDAPAPQQSSPGVALSIDPSEKTVKAGEELPIEVWLDTDGENINAVKAVLEFSPEAFEVVSVDGSESAFTIEAENTSGNGQIRISRGEFDGLTGRQLLAKVVLIPRFQSGSESIRIAEESVAGRHGDSSDVLSRKIGATYTLEASE